MRCREHDLEEKVSSYHKEMNMAAGTGKKVLKDSAVLIHQLRENVEHNTEALRTLHDLQEAGKREVEREFTTE